MAFTQNLVPQRKVVMLTSDSEATAVVSGTISGEVSVATLSSWGETESAHLNIDGPRWCGQAHQHSCDVSWGT